MSAVNKTWADRYKRFGTTLRVHFSTAVWTVRKLASIAPWLTAGLTITTLIRGITPAGLVLAIRGLINSIVEQPTGAGADTTGVTPWLVLAFAVVALEAVSSIARRYFKFRLHDEANIALSTEIMMHASAQAVSFFEHPNSQNKLERLQDQIGTRFIGMVHRMMLLITGTIQIVSLCTILFFIEPLILLVAAPLFIPYMIFQWRLSRDIFSEHYKRAEKRRWIKYFVTMLTRPDWVAEIKLFGLSKHFVHQFSSIMDKIKEYDRHIYFRSFAGSSIFALLTLVGFFAIFAKVVVSALSGEVSVGDVAIFVGAVVRLRKSLEDSILSVTAIMEQIRHVMALRDFLGTEPETTTADGVVPTSFTPAVVFDHVSFSYPGSKLLALSDVSLEIRPGETIAIVGENGSGKSTLAKLLTRFYDPDDGHITLSGVDLRDLSTEFLQRQIAFVFQNFARYSASAADNIAYGDWHRLQDNREEVQRIARLCGLDEAIGEMAQGYDTILGQQFGALEPSGGIWQRIAIARAFGRNSSLLILDEPTANVDVRAEYELFRQLNDLARDKTTILISHRFSTVSMADRIIVLDKGRVVEQGTHAALLIQGRHYAKLYSYYERRMKNQ